MTGHRGIARLRLVVRRTRLIDPTQAQLWPDWRYHAFITSLDRPDGRRSISSTATTPPSNSRSVTSKKAPGSNTARPGKFFANAAWLACAVLAHNLIRWTARLGDVTPTTNSPSRAPSAPGSSRCPAGSSTAADDTRFDSRHDGPGPTLFLSALDTTTRDPDSSPEHTRSPSRRRPRRRSLARTRRQTRAIGDHTTNDRAPHTGHSHEHALNDKNRAPDDTYAIKSVDRG